jgi:hypothetical protein
MFFGCIRYAGWHCGKHLCELSSNVNILETKKNKYNSSISIEYILGYHSISKRYISALVVSSSVNKPFLKPAGLHESALNIGDSYSLWCIALSSKSSFIYLFTLRVPHWAVAVYVSILVLTLFWEPAILVPTYVLTSHLSLAIRTLVLLLTITEEL